MDITAKSKFRSLTLTTLIAVYILIGVGSTVRTTGSGMGCPDWPKCYGSWVPPTDVSQLPANYKEVNAALREKKNEKFVSILRTLGFTESANEIEQDKTILQEGDFNAAHTWTEYANRLAGVVIGILIVLLLWKSVAFRREMPAIFYLTLAVFVAVIFEAWFGSIVVSTRLTTWTITIHMFVALMMVVLLLMLYRLTDHQYGYEGTQTLRPLLVVCMAVVLGQIYLGSQVREAMDRLMSAGVERTSLISVLGMGYFLHRSFSWLVIVLHIFLVLQLWKTSVNKTLVGALMAVILAAIFAGVGMAYGSVPAFLQPLHLVLATVSFGIQLLLYFRLNPAQQAAN